MSPRKKPTLLIADDDENIVFAFRETFHKSANVISASDGVAALKQLRSGKAQIAFVDITMPKLDGLSVLKTATEAGIQIPIVIITGFGTMSTAIDAMKEGAFDYITKPLDIDNLRAVADRAFEVARLRLEIQELKTELVTTRWEDEFIGSHPSMQEVFKNIGMVLQTPVGTNILITGESGTGKELVARAIHKSGANAEQPFIAINCAAVPENLIETELFGHEKGAFTGASNARDGKFKVAGSGTIFLDEIGDLPVAMQVKLLRVLEARDFTPIGGHRVISVKARFIAATNHDLKARVDEGNYRADLYYRLNVFNIHVPPLRDRREDIPALVKFIVNRHSKGGSRQKVAVSDEAMALLMTFDYPGNVRELQNILIRAASQGSSGLITAKSLAADIPRPSTGADGRKFDSLTMKAARGLIVKQFEEDYINKLLLQCVGNVSLAAKTAGMTRQSFQRMMRSHSIQSSDFRK